MRRYEDPAFQLRLGTFEEFPATGKTAESLAAAGFKYKGYNDIVKCSYCSLELKNWEHSDPRPFIVHMKKSPDCPFFKPPISDIVPLQHIHSTDRDIRQFVKNALSHRPICEILLGPSHPAERTCAPRFQHAEVRAALREFAERRGVLSLPSAEEIVRLIYSRETPQGQ